jgi:hypothetical protein
MPVIYILLINNLLKTIISLYKTRKVQIDSNVYKLDTSLFTYDEDTGNLIEEVKQLKDLTALIMD